MRRDHPVQPTPGGAAMRLQAESPPGVIDLRTIMKGCVLPLEGDEPPAIRVTAGTAALAGRPPCHKAVGKGMSSSRTALIDPQRHPRRRLGS